jgi:hypothetical protein
MTREKRELQTTPRPHQQRTSSTRNNRAFSCLTCTKLPDASEREPEKPDFCNGWKTRGGRERPMTDPSVSITRAQLTCPYRLPGGRAYDGGAPSRYSPVPGPRSVPSPPGGAVTSSHRGGLDTAAGVGAGCLRSRAAGQPAPPAGIRVGCLQPRQRCGRARGHRPGPPRARPCRPSLRQGRAACQPQPRRRARLRGLTSFPSGKGRAPRAAARRRRPGGGRT